MNWTEVDFWKFSFKESPSRNHLPPKQQKTVVFLVPFMCATYSTGIQFWAIKLILSGRGHAKEVPVPFLDEFCLSWIVPFWSYWTPKVDQSFHIWIHNAALAHYAMALAVCYSTAFARWQHTTTWCRPVRVLSSHYSFHCIQCCLLWSRAALT